MSRHAPFPARPRRWAALGVVLSALAMAACSAPSTPGPTAYSVYEGVGASSEVRVAVEIDLAAAEIGFIPPDSIKPIYDPRFVSPDDADLVPGDFVIGLALNGEAKAYPIEILWSREMVNDTVGGVPLLVTW